MSAKRRISRILVTVVFASAVAQTPLHAGDGVSIPLERLRGYASACHAALRDGRGGPLSMIYRFVRSTLDSTPGVGSRSRWVHDKVSILWFPRHPPFQSCTHMKLMVDGQVYNGLRHYVHEGKFESFCRLSSMDLRKRFYEFQISVTPEELERLKAFVEGGFELDRLQHPYLYSTGNCGVRACRPLNAVTNAYFPRPFVQFPSWAAIYYTLLRLKSYLLRGRVGGVRYFGGDENFKTLVSGDLAFESQFTGALALYAGVLFALAAAYEPPKAESAIVVAPADNPNETESDQSER